MWLRTLIEAIRPAKPPAPLPGARVFRALGVQVLNGHVYAADGLQLGLLPGATATVVDASGHMIYGVITANPLPSRPKGAIRTNWDGAAIVAFANGTTYRERCLGQRFLNAQAEASAFNAMASAAEGHG